MIWALAISVALGGALIAAQGPIYMRMSQVLGGPVQAAMLAFAIGAGALALILMLIGGPLPRRDAVLAVPVWAWFGALIGVYVVIVSIFAVPRMGVASYMVCVIAGQLAASYAYDRLGAFGLEPRIFSTTNLIGLGLVSVGSVLTVWR